MNFWKLVVLHSHKSLCLIQHQVDRVISPAIYCNCEGCSGSGVTELVLFHGKNLFCPD